MHLFYDQQRYKRWAKHLLCGIAFACFYPGVTWALVPYVIATPDQKIAPDVFSERGTTSSLDENSLLERIVNFNESTLQQQRAQFREAEKALRLRQTTQFQALLPELADYPLYPYLLYQDLKHRLNTASTQELTAYFNRYQDLPVADLLRKTLLRHLARRGHWQRYVAFYTPTQNTRLQCQYLYGLIRTGQAEKAYPEIEKLWRSGRSQPSVCNRVFKHWKAAGLQTSEHAWQRMELALDNGHRTLARYLVRLLPADEQKLARLWIKLHRKPQLLPRYLRRISRSHHPMAATVFTNIVKRLARRSPQDAADIWFGSDIQAAANPQQQFDMLQHLAISVARSQQPGAEAWFAIIPQEYLSDTAREWRVRAALRQSQWSLALVALDALRPEQQDSDRWQYWRARVNEELGDTLTAMSFYTDLSRQRSYYGFLAADRLGRPYTIADRPHQTSAGTLYTLGQQQAVQRAREFLRLGRLVNARREWRLATQHMTNDERSDAAKLAQYWGWAEQSILTMASTDQRDDISLRFPLLFQQQVLNHSERADIDPAWTYGVIRQESAFVKDARSNSGALGLMQLMPATAKSIARNLPKKYRGKAKLTQADTNLALGTRYLRRMLKRFGGQTVLATAAYNAGARRIMGWLPAETTLDAERWIETIPFRETREYVTSVLAFTVIYADRLGIEQKTLSQQMPAVPSRETL